MADETVLNTVHRKKLQKITSVRIVRFPFSAIYAMWEIMFVHMLFYIKIINGSIVKSDPKSANYSFVLCYHKLNECYVFYEPEAYISTLFGAIDFFYLFRLQQN